MWKADNRECNMHVYCNMKEFEFVEEIFGVVQ